IIEDNDDAREMMRFALEREGHIVEESADGTRGVEMALATVPDVALIDIGLPGVDGFEVARRIRASAAAKSITPAPMPGCGQPEDRRRGEEAGFDAHLVKPVDPERLSTLLASTSR